MSHVTLSAGIKTRGSELSGRFRFIQQRTPTTRTDCLRSLCQLQSALKSSQHRLCTKAGDSVQDEYPPLPTYQTDSKQEEKEVHVIQLKGLPWSCTTHDLLQFFQECRICDGEKGIHIVVDRMGRPSGQAFIEMEHEEDVSKALKMHRQYLGPRYVEVYEVTNVNAEAILNTFRQTTANNNWVVRLRGLPFTCTEAEIVHFFSGLDVMENGITFITNYRGRNTGEAYVQFSSQEAVDEALRRDREEIGNRYIEVFPSSRDEIRLSMSSSSLQTSSQSMTRKSVSAMQTNVTTGSSQRSSMPLHYVHMRGLPFEVSAKDIVKFFSPLVVSKILIKCDPDGRLSGEADVYFSCHEDAVAAMSRDLLHIGERYIELFLNSVTD